MKKCNWKAGVRLLKCGGHWSIILLLWVFKTAIRGAFAGKCSTDAPRAMSRDSFTPEYCHRMSKYPKTLGGSYIKWYSGMAFLCQIQYYVLKTTLKSTLVQIVKTRTTSTPHSNITPHIYIRDVDKYETYITHTTLPIHTRTTHTSTSPGHHLHNIFLYHTHNIIITST